LNLSEYYLPLFILSIHFRKIPFFKITKDIQSNNNNNIVLRGISPKMMWSLTSSSRGYINGRNSANLELLIDKTSSIYLYVKLKALASKDLLDNLKSRSFSQVSSIKTFDFSTLDTTA
jgi:hypothetical protein